MIRKDLIFDWNNINKSNKQCLAVELCDETLRDGLQSPSIIDPAIEAKYELLSLMNELKIDIANIGLPKANRRAYEHSLLLAQYKAKHKLNIKLSCAARTHEDDIKPIIDIIQKAGVDITAYCFLGTSPIRQLVEKWDLAVLQKTSEQAISFAIKHDVNVAFVTEDTTRSDRHTLSTLFSHAISLGVERLVLCDTVGHASPHGVKNLLDFTKEVIALSKSPIAIDWHGHNDRGLALINAMIALEYGAHRLHATALGIGERVGNTSMDHLMINLKLMGYDYNLKYLSDYVTKTASYCHVAIPYNYPGFGEDAFKTATGVHAAAIIKARQYQDNNLQDIIYASIPASWLGKEQIIELGPMSGRSNVKYFLAKENITESDALIDALLHYAKSSDKIIPKKDLLNFIDNIIKSSP